MIILDGNYGEGGGQIIRTALAFSLFTGKPFTISNIRSNRPQPGLKTQHLKCVESCKLLSNADVEGASLGSKKITFSPNSFSPRSIEIDIGTAGSITLLMQSLMLPLVLSSKNIRLRLTGGTDTRWSPTYDYFSGVFLPQLRRFAEIESTLVKRGYYPRGNGEVRLKIVPKRADRPYNLTEQHNLIQIKGISHASKELMNRQVAERQAKSAKLLFNKYDVPIDIRTEYSETDSLGSCITLWAIFSKDPEDIDFISPIRIGYGMLGEQNKKAELVGTEAAGNLLSQIQSKAAVDEYLADQLMPFLALAGGSIVASRITNHALTNIYVIEKFLGKTFDFSKKPNTIMVKQKPL